MYSNDSLGHIKPELQSARAALSLFSYSMLVSCSYLGSWLHFVNAAVWWECRQADRQTSKYFGTWWFRFFENQYLGRIFFLKKTSGWVFYWNLARPVMQRKLSRDAVESRRERMESVRWTGRELLTAFQTRFWAQFCSDHREAYGGGFFSLSYISFEDDLDRKHLWLRWHTPFLGRL